METKEYRDDVTITYFQVVPEDRQDACFYTWTHEYESLAQLEYKDRTLHIGRNGYMRLSIPAEDMETGEWVEHEVNVCLYTDELERFAKTDFELGQLYDLWWNERGIDIWHNNPWWEVYNDEILPDGEVFGDFYEAVDFAVKLIKDDTEWTND